MTAGAMKVADVAERYSVSTQTVYRALRSGKLRGSKVGSDWRILPEDAVSWFEAGVPQIEVVEVAAPRRTVVRRSRRGGHQGGGLRALMATDGGAA